MPYINDIVQLQLKEISKYQIMVFNAVWSGFVIPLYLTTLYNTLLCNTKPYVLFLTSINRNDCNFFNVHPVRAPLVSEPVQFPNSWISPLSVELMVRYCTCQNKQRMNKQLKGTWSKFDSICISNVRGNNTSESGMVTISDDVIMQIFVHRRILRVKNILMQITPRTCYTAAWKVSWYMCLNLHLMPSYAYITHMYQ